MPRGQDETIAEIARKVLRVQTLETQRSDRLDFHELAVWSIHHALQRAYDAGLRAGHDATRPTTIVPEETVDSSSSEPDRNPPAAAEPESTIVAHHRNGVAGAPFNVVLFTDHGPHGSRKLGIVFEAAYHVAVFDVAKLAAGDIAFCSNSWRGDQFERMLRAMIAPHEAAD